MKIKKLIKKALFKITKNERFRVWREVHIDPEGLTHVPMPVGFEEPVFHRSWVDRSVRAMTEQFGLQNWQIEQLMRSGGANLQPSNELFTSMENDNEDHTLGIMMARHRDQQRYLNHTRRFDDMLHLKPETGNDPHPCRKIPKDFIIYPHVSGKYWILINKELDMLLHDLQRRNGMGFMGMNSVEARYTFQLMTHLPITFCPFCGVRLNEWYLEDKETGLRILLDIRKDVHERWVNWIKKKAEYEVETETIREQIKGMKVNV